MAEDPDPAAVADAAAGFCADYDDGEQALETLLAVDADHETWTFDDLPLDSGTFGELVSRDIVTNADGDYRVSSREGVRAALEGESVPAADDAATGGVLSPGSFDLDGVDRRAVVGLVGALVVLFAMRLLQFRSVFRGGEVVSPGNDPYYYRYWMAELLARSDGLTDWSVVTAMPDGAAGRRPFTHAANWFLASLLGGDQWAADAVAAWLPVVATLALGIVVYRLTVVLTDDVRVGLASVVLLALTPVHAVYSSVGFLEHRPYQYFWLGVTLLALAWLAVDLQRRREGEVSSSGAIREHLRQPWTWFTAVVLGIALALSAHAWGGSALMFIPVAGYIGLKVAVDVRDGLSPARANAPVLAGLGVGAAVAALLHVRWGWHETFTALVPLLVLVGGIAVAGLGELWRRLEWPSGGLVGLAAVLAAVGLVAFRDLRPDDWARLRTRADDLLFREGATETGSLFTTDNAVIFEPMAQLGINFYVAVVVLAWACWVAYRRYEPGWLLLSVYGGYWLVLAAIQVRFAAQLAIPLAVLGGLGLVHLLAWVDLARVPRPFRERDGAARGESTTRGTAADGGERDPSIVVPADRKKIVALVWVALLVCGLSLIFVPSLSAQTVHSNAQFEATMAIDEHATDTDREYPDNFVLSRWGDNRMYNYFVSGEAERYGYAQSNFDSFIADDDPDSWYAEEFDGRVGYVVMTDQDEDVPVRTAQAQLHEELGTGGNGSEPLEHYRALYVDEEVTAFAVVPGATITASGEAGGSVTVATEVTVSGEPITYEREVTVAENGTLEATVPYPGEYTVGGESVDVSPAAVEQGETVALE